jgi:hypothetical protein
MHKRNHIVIINFLTKQIAGFALLILFLFTQRLNAQQQLSISLDRGLYIAGETLQANVGIVDCNCNSPIYVYCDLLAQNGQQFSGLKIKLDGSAQKFSFPLNKNLKSGYYYLRAYYYSRDFKIGEFDYAFFKLVNTSNNEVVEISQNKTNSVKPDSLFQKDNQVQILTNKKTYQKRELVELNINLDTNINPNYTTVSVVPKNSFSRYTYNSDKLKDVAIIDNRMTSLQLSGTLKSKKTKRPISNKRILLSVVNSNDVMSAISDSLGKWKVLLPDYYGIHEIIISPEEDNADFDISVNKEFYHGSSISVNNKFSLDSSEQKLVLSLASNNIVARAFQKNNIVKEVSFNNKIFYNKADQTIRILDFIDMPKLSMYFTELSGPVHLSKRKGKYEIRIIDKNGIQLLHKPLLLVDNVPVSDLEYILAINPTSVNRIEIINSDYQKGDAIFGGIINFITNKLDFGGLSFPESSVSINYQFLENNSENKQNISIKSNEPDARNTLAVFNRLSQKNTFHFYTSDVLGEYQIIVQTINKEGQRRSYYSFFVVDAK